MKAYGDPIVTFAVSGDEWVTSKPSGFTSHPGADWLSLIVDLDVLRSTDPLIFPGIGPRYLVRTDRNSVIATNLRVYQYDIGCGGSGNRYLPDKIVAVYMVL
jgi:hypothetical protein